MQGPQFLKPGKWCQKAIQIRCSEITGPAFFSSWSFQICLRADPQTSTNINCILRFFGGPTWKMVPTHNTNSIWSKKQKTKTNSTNHGCLGIFCVCVCVYACMWYLFVCGVCMYVCVCVRLCVYVCGICLFMYVCMYVRLCACM